MGFKPYDWVVQSNPGYVWGYSSTRRWDFRYRLEELSDEY